jgi:hypothetical protein
MAAILNRLVHSFSPIDTRGFGNGLVLVVHQDVIPEEINPDGFYGPGEIVVSARVVT